jgi:diadenylate cyclase
LNELLRPLVSLRDPSWETLVSVIDILLVSYLFYRILLLIRGTRGWRIILGIFFFLTLLFLSKRLGLYALDWVLEKALILLPVALVILFLPELRQAIEGMGRLGFWSQKITGFEPVAETQSIEEIVEAASELAAARVGALIVIERAASLGDVAETGVAIDAKVTAPLLGSIFFTGNPLHDGAVIIHGDRIVAAACRLPFSESARLAHNLHMRHRAAVGITEQRDCVAIVVSEERGTISYVVEGVLRKVTPHELRECLNRDLKRQAVKYRPEWTRRLNLGKSREKRIGPRVS